MDEDGLYMYSYTAAAQLIAGHIQGSIWETLRDALKGFGGDMRSGTSDLGQIKEFYSAYVRRVASRLLTINMTMP